MHDVNPYVNFGGPGGTFAEYERRAAIAAARMPEIDNIPEF